MRDRLKDRLTAFASRVRRFERRELRELGAWIERTNNFVHLSALLFVPLLVAVVTYLSNTVETISFLLFPPLASGTYTLFSNPRGKYASPTRFVAGLTVGALCGWLALELSGAMVPSAPAGRMGVSVLGAAVAVFLAGAVTWFGDVEEPAAYSTALLGLLVPLETQPTFVTSVALSSVLVAAVFSVWRSEFYEHRADILYQSTSGDDHVLVPMVGDHADATAMLGARIAAAHDAGKVVLLDVVGDETVARAERKLLDRHGDGTPATTDATGSRSFPGGSKHVEELAADVERDAPPGGPEVAVADAVRSLEARAAAVERAAGVPCEVVVAVGDDDAAGTVLRTARGANCDLIAVPYRERRGTVAPFVRDLFASELDVLVHRSVDGRTDWDRVMVPVRKTGHVAHSMVDFALRLAGEAGSISVSHCVGPAGSHRGAEEMLADLVEPFAGPIETRIARGDVVAFLESNAVHYDVVLVGASRDRSTASRLVSRPTFERLENVESDVVVVDRG